MNKWSHRVGRLRAMRDGVFFLAEVSTQESGKDGITQPSVDFAQDC